MMLKEQGAAESGARAQPLHRLFLVSIYQFSHDSFVSGVTDSTETSHASRFSTPTHLVRAAIEEKQRKPICLSHHTCTHLTFGICSLLGYSGYVTMCKKADAL